MDAPTNNLENKHLADRVIRSIMGPISRLYGALLGLFCDPGPIFPSDYIPWIPELETHWQTMREEMDRVMRNHDIPSFDEVVAGEAGIADYRWKVFTFRIYGTLDITDNCKQCPKTYALIRDLPGVTTAWLSILEPGKHVRAHRGPFRGVLRCLLALKVPGKPGDCRIRIEDQMYHFQEGKCLIFDDTFEHEVWNDSDDYRAVLFLDVKRPLPIPVRWLNDFVLWLIGVLVVPRLADRSRAVASPRQATTAPSPGDPIAPAPSRSEKEEALQSRS